MYSSWRLHRVSRSDTEQQRTGHFRRPMLYPPELQARAEIIATYRTGGNRGRGRCARKCARQAASDVLEITWTHDVVAIEHGPRSVPGHRHRDAFRNPNPKIVGA